MIKMAVKKKKSLFILFINKITKNSMFHWSKRIEREEKSHEINAFLQNTLAIIIGSLLLNIFAKITLEFSPIMPDEFGEQLTRDQRPFLHTDHSDSQVHLSASSLQFRPLIRSENWDGHGRRFILCSGTHFCVDFHVCFGSLSW